MLVGAGVLIDLRQGRYRLTHRDVCDLLNELKPALWPVHNRIALGLLAGHRTIWSCGASVCRSEAWQRTFSTTSTGRSSGWPRRKNPPSSINHCLIAAAKIIHLVAAPRLSHSWQLSKEWRLRSRREPLRALSFYDLPRGKYGLSDQVVQLAG